MPEVPHLQPLCLEQLFSYHFTANDVASIFLDGDRIRAPMREGVVTKLKPRVEPHLQQRDLIFVAFPIGVEFVLVDESDRRHLRLLDVSEESSRNVFPLLSIALRYDHRQIVDRYGDRLALPLHKKEATGNENY